MKIELDHALMAHAALVPSLALAANRRRAPEVKEATDPALLSAEVKKAVEDLMKTFETFKTKNDERLAQIEKKGSADPVTKEEVDRINKAIDAAQDLAKKRADEIEAKLNRMAVNPGGNGPDEVKAAADFSLIAGKTVSIEELRNYRRDLNQALRMRPEQVKAVTMSVGVDPAGGFLVTPDTSGRMIKKIYETSPFRQICNVVTIGTDSLQGPIDNGEPDAAWVGENATRNQTDAPQFGQWEIPVNELYAYPKVTQKLLDDASIDIEAWLAQKAQDKLGRKENTAFAIGTGILQPKGLWTYSVAATSDKAGRAWGTFEYLPSGAAGAFATTGPGDALINLIYALKTAYRINARWMMARATVSAVRQLKDAYGQYLWQPGMQAGQPSTLLNFPIAEGEDVPQIAANAYALAFGDFAETYTIVDRLGMTVIRDNITQPGFVKYNFRKRVGGGAVNFEALKFLKMAVS